MAVRLMPSLGNNPVCIALVAIALWAPCASTLRLSWTQPVGARRYKSANGKLNNRPLIGVLTQPGEPAPGGHSYIAASYVKFIESAGARVVPIQFDLPVDEVKRRFQLINGVLIPGGGQNLSPGHPFYDTSKLLLSLALESNDRGDYFPVHGTCLGFETLAVVVSGNSSILGTFSAENLPSPLFLTDKAHKSYFWNSLSKAVRKDLKEKPYAMENHESGLSVRAFDESKSLQDFFNVISVTEDRDGAFYVSTMEARKYPVTATQWHPEKNAYEWAHHLDIPHSRGAVAVTTAVANFIVDEARNSLNAPASILEEDELLIYNFPPHFTGKHSYEGEEVDFDESYFFPPEVHRPRLIGEARSQL